MAGAGRPRQPADPSLKLPHVGWNDVEPTAHPLFEGLDAPQMYFTHSYAFAPRDPGSVIARTDYGGDFAAAVAQGNVAGVQFHPEKSQAQALRLIARFLEWRP